MRPQDLVQFVGKAQPTSPIAKHAEEALRQAQADLARINLGHSRCGESTASLAHEVNSANCRRPHRREVTCLPALAYARNNPI